MGAKLRLNFEGEDGKTVTFTYNYADPDASSTNVQRLVQGLITNGSIFENPPVAAKSAVIVITTEKAFDVSA